MGRPQKRNVDYFPHMCTHGKTMYILEGKHGNNGYAFWFKLLEMIGSTPEHFIDCRNDGTWEFLQAKTHIDGDSIIEILDLLAKLEAIDTELWAIRVIWSQNFIDGITPAYTNRKIAPPLRPNHLLGLQSDKPSCGVVSTDRNEDKLNNE